MATKAKKGHIICANCGLVGHVSGQCPDREWVQGPRRTLYLTLPEDRPRVADRPRRCGVCGEPTIETVDGAVLDDRPRFRGRPHLCLQDRKSA